MRAVPTHTTIVTTVAGWDKVFQCNDIGDHFDVFVVSSFALLQERFGFFECLWLAFRKHKESLVIGNISWHSWVVIVIMGLVKNFPKHQAFGWQRYSGRLWFSHVFLLGYN